ncbi:MAG: PH domain-containing protein [Anaerolineales bacterium]|nr:PH domain-containing protein [Anaerolineales bacterium]
MTPITYRPNKKYLRKSYLTLVIVGVLTTLFSVLLGYFIGLSSGGSSGARLGTIISIGLNLLWFVPVLIIVYPYYKSLFYEIHEEEVIMHVGVITRSVKHVPFRTVTNIKVNRGPFDRLFGLGTVDIQTAGISGQTGAEESLVGLENYREVYDKIASTLRRFRGAMSPIQTDVDVRFPGETYSQEVLEELREIRRLLEVAE